MTWEVVGVGLRSTEKQQQSEPSSHRIVSRGARTQPRDFRDGARDRPKARARAQEGDFQLEPPLPESAVVLLSVWTQKQK